MFVILRNGGKQVGESEEYERHDEIESSHQAEMLTVNYLNPNLVCYTKSDNLMQQNFHNKEFNLQINSDYLFLLKDKKNKIYSYKT